MHRSAAAVSFRGRPPGPTGLGCRPALTQCVQKHFAVGPVTVIFLLCLTLLATALWPVPALALPPGWRVTQLTNNNCRDDGISIDRSNIAYATHPLGLDTTDISIYAAGTGTTRSVVTGALQAAPHLDGTRVAYVSGLGDAAEIYVWDAITGITRRVTSNDRQDAAPSLRGTMLAWQRWDGSDWEIYWMDLSSGGEQHFANNFVDDFGPVVEGDLLAWRQEDPAGEFGEVFVKMYNIATATHLLVTPHSDPAENLRLDDGLLAFVSTPDFPAKQLHQIMLYNANTRALRAVTTDLDHHIEMEMSGGRIAYVIDDDAGPDTRIVLYDIEARSSRSITYFAPNRARWPDLTESWVFWQDWDGHDWEIAGYHFATHSLVRLTDNSINDDYPRAHSSRVAWTGWETGVDSEIFLASFSLPFIDLPMGHAYRRAIENLFILEIMSGYDATHFGPNDPLLRQQFAKMIVLTTGVSCTEADHCRFVDVSNSGPGSLYPDNYVEAAAREELTRGTSSTEFSPYDHISRVQAMTMVVRAAQRFVGGGLAEPPAGWDGHFAGFSDPTHGHNAKLAEYNGLLAGIDLDGWDEWADATRGEVAQMLWNLWELMSCG